MIAIARRVRLAVLAVLVGVVAAPALANTLASPVVFFESGSAALVPTARIVLDDALERMILPGVRNGSLAAFQVTGHADRAGPDDRNMQLSIRRAEAVRDYLVSRGVPTRLIGVLGYGEAQPLVETADGVVEPQNRYAMILFR